MLTRLLLTVAAVASFASAQSSSSSGAAFPSSSSGSVVTGVQSSSGSASQSSSQASGSFSSSSFKVDNGTSSTGMMNTTSSTGAFFNGTSSTGSMMNMTSSTGMMNMTSSSGAFFNGTSSTGMMNMTSSSGAFFNGTSSSGAFFNGTSSTGMMNMSSSTGVMNMTSSTGSVIPPPIGSTGSGSMPMCGGAGYDLSSIANSDLTLDDGDNIYAIHPCGVVSPDLDLCDGQMCEGDTVISRYEPALVNWISEANGVRMEVQNGDDDDCEGPRQSDIFFQCNSTYLSPSLISVSTTSSCHFRAVVYTAAACSRNSSYQPGVGSAFESSICGGGAYDFSALNSADIISEIDGYNWTIRVCGPVSNPACSSVQPASICQQDGDSVYKLADYNNYLPIYEINDNGMNMTLESGTPCGDLGNRTTMVQFECDPSAITPQLVEASEYYTCEYWFHVRTNAVCGAPFAIQNGTSSSTGVPQVRSSSTGVPQVSSSSTGAQSSSTAAGFPSSSSVIAQSSSSQDFSASSSSTPIFVDSSSSSAESFPSDSSSPDVGLPSSTAGEDLDDPSLNGAAAMSVSGVAVIVSLMAVAIAL